LHRCVIDRACPAAGSLRRINPAHDRPAGRHRGSQDRTGATHFVPRVRPLVQPHSSPYDLNSGNNDANAAISVFERADVAVQLTPAAITVTDGEGAALDITISSTGPAIAPFLEFDFDPTRISQPSVTQGAFDCDWTTRPARCQMNNIDAGGQPPDRAHIRRARRRNDACRGSHRRAQRHESGQQLAIDHGHHSGGDASASTVPSASTSAPATELFR
jgi:hypothetical protein